MLNENLKLSGQVNIALTKADGTVETTEINNLVVNAGLAFIAARMTSATSAVMSHMALGSDATAANAAQTDLVTTLGARVSLDSTGIAGANNEQVVYVATFSAGEATGAIQEAGIFNALTGGDMLCRTVFPVVNKAAGDSVTITWTITLAAS